jgi:hypothetical protein
MWAGIRCAVTTTQQRMPRAWSSLCMGRCVLNVAVNTWPDCQMLSVRPRLLQPRCYSMLHWQELGLTCHAEVGHKYGPRPCASVRTALHTAAVMHLHYCDAASFSQTSLKA